MADIRPFKAYRPEKSLASRIAALPYDVYNSAEARVEVEKEPYSFLKIDRAETQFPEGTDLYSKEVYEKAASSLREMMDKGEFRQDENAGYYLYELTMDGRSQTGIVGVASVDDYRNGIIKKHENTRADKEEDRIRHVDTCNAQTGPIFLAYRDREDIRELVENVKKGEPENDFISPDGVGHRVWVISDSKQVSALQGAFGEMQQIYIADGHHRCASAAKVSLKRREENPSYTGEEEFNYFLSVLFPDSQLKILDYNRVIRDLNGLTEEELLVALSEEFTLTLVSEEGEPYSPEDKGYFGMFLNGKWYKLHLQTPLQGDPVWDLDVSILQEKVLTPIFGIEDPKTDKRIDFVGGIRGLGELEKRCHEDAVLAFSMFPTSIEELFAVADANRLMPPKSTWFEPKLRSGLFIHDLA